MKSVTYLSFLMIVFFFSAGLMLAQDSTQHKHSHKNDMKMKRESVPSEIDTADTGKKQNTSIIREGAIDLKEIDVNKDGKVFQDQMDWNVISDEPGECPICEMTLKEVTINKAKYNLHNNGFEVKD